MKKVSVNMATKIFEQNLIDLINNSGLPEINVLFILNQTESLVRTELTRKIEEEQKKLENDKGE